MKRKAYIVDHDIHKKLFIAVDEEIASVLLPYISRDQVQEEWRFIRDILKQNLRNKDKYCKCDVDQSSNKMFEMRFTNKSRNDRIYCQELSEGKRRVIVMGFLFEGKKTDHIPLQIKKRISTLSKVEYEIIW